MARPLSIVPGLGGLQLDVPAHLVSPPGSTPPLAVSLATPGAARVEEHHEDAARNGARIRGVDQHPYTSLTDHHASPVHRLHRVYAPHPSAQFGDLRLKVAQLLPLIGDNLLECRHARFHREVRCLRRSEEWCGQHGCHKRKSLHAAESSAARAGRR